jgi:hypothetical protein
MSQSVYDTDILEWSEQQASALRELARTRPDLSNVLDWENVAEEIECVGRSEFTAVQSFVRLILIHVIKAVSVPNSDAMLHWRKEVVGFHDELIARISPSMHARIDLPRLWQRAAKAASADLAPHGQSVTPDLPAQCPLTVGEIVDPDFDFLRTVENVRGKIGRSKRDA